MTGRALHGTSPRMRTPFALLLAAALAACAGPLAQRPPAPAVQVRIIAFNDFHGAVEPPRQAVPARTAAGQEVRVPAGGAAWLASAVRRLRAGHPNNLVVSAGDLISASPLVSAQFLDEPTILAMNMIGLDFNAVGNHEFDRGRDELLRMQNGGCARHTEREPCRVDRDFPGARFRFLAANVSTQEGGTLFPAASLRSFGRGRRQVQVGLIGLTLRQTPTLVTPSGVAGLAFGDEAEAINREAARLRGQGADAIVVLIHQGLAIAGHYDDRACPGVSGDLLPILARLDRSVDLVVSGHTHNAYVCTYDRTDPDRPILVTSAGRNGTMLTQIDLAIDPSAGRVVEARADQVIVQSEAYRGASGEVATTDLYPRFERDPAVAALVARYAEAAAPIIRRVVGRLSAPALREATPAGESVLGDLIADAHLAATRAPDAGGAQLAFTNQTGVRADLVPAADGGVTYGQIFSAQPFGNSLTVQSLSGRQIRALLEQQFASGTNTAERPIILPPSSNFTYSYDLRRPVGQRIIDPRLDGQPLRDDAIYRVTTNSFLAAGGDNFTVLRDGANPTGGPQDIDALERYLAAADRLAVPAATRITRLDRRD